MTNGTDLGHSTAAHHEYSRLFHITHVLQDFGSLVCVWIPWGLGHGNHRWPVGLLKCGINRSWSKLRLNGSDSSGYLGNHPLYTYFACSHSTNHRGKRKILMQLFARMAVESTHVSWKQISSRYITRSAHLPWRYHFADITACAAHLFTSIANGLYTFIYMQHTHTHERKNWQGARFILIYKFIQF